MSSSHIAVRFVPPPDDLRRYFTTFYLVEIDVPDGGIVKDSLHPEWANLRIVSGGLPIGWFDGGEPISNARFVATGPSSKAAHFTVGSTRFWGIGLLPLGWARFIGKPAAEYANLVADGMQHPDFAAFRPLADSVFGAATDPDGEYARIAEFFRALPPIDDRDAGRITAVHAALVDPAVGSVTELVEACGIGQRTVERICHNAFGFSPRLLLRRQRFMRSLAQFMLDPSLRWIGAIDAHYHDQAQFVRDFREFVGVTPSEYATRPHPVIDTFVRERARMVGAPVQTMDLPAGTAPPN